MIQSPARWSARQRKSSLAERRRGPRRRQAGAGPCRGQPPRHGWHAAAGGQNLGGVHAWMSSGLVSPHRITASPACAPRFVGVNTTWPKRRRASRERAPRHRGRRWGPGRVQQLVEGGGRSAGSRWPVDQPFSCRRRFSGRRGGSFADRFAACRASWTVNSMSCIAVMALENPAHFGQLAEHRRHSFLHRGNWLSWACCRRRSIAAACECRRPHPRPGR